MNAHWIFSLHENYVSVLPFIVVIVVVVAGAVYHSTISIGPMPRCYCCVKKELNTNKIINKMRWQKSFFIGDETMKRWSNEVVRNYINNRRTFNEIFLSRLSVLYTHMLDIHLNISCVVFLCMCARVCYSSPFILVCPFSFIVSIRFE